MSKTIIISCQVCNSIIDHKHCIWCGEIVNHLIAKTGKERETCQTSCMVNSYVFIRKINKIIEERNVDVLFDFAQSIINARVLIPQKYLNRQYKMLKVTNSTNEYCIL